MSRGKVVTKIITGSDGYNIPALAHSLRNTPPVGTGDLVNRCHDHGLDNCIIQLGSTTWIGDVEYLPPLYKEKFDIPEFNPRWENGTAAYTEIVYIDDYYLSNG